MLTLKTFATFWAICVLWSFWTADSVAQWLSLWSALKGQYTWSVLLYPGLVLTVIVLGSLERNPLRNVRPSKVDQRAWLRARLVTAVSLVALVGVSIEAVHQSLGTEVATTIHSLRSGHLSRLDMAKLERGYYENLLSVDRFNSQLWEVYSKRPANWLDVQGANLKRFTGGFAQNELIPSFVSTTPYGTISTNRWGMRDKDYERTPPPNTFRIAVLGASTVMGWGVGDGETFESIVEERLNRDKPNQAYAGYEMLNFGVPGHQPPQELVTLDYALGFKPNAIYYVATTREISRAESYLIEIVQKKVPIPYEPLRDIVDRAGLEPSMDEATAMKRLRPFGAEILSWIYRHMVEDARSHGVIPVFVFLPALPEELWQDETVEILKIAGTAGFPVIDLSGVYKGQETAALSLAEWDHHPNRRGHQLIAARLDGELRKMQPSVLGADLRAASN